MTEVPPAINEPGGDSAGVIYDSTWRRPNGASRVTDLDSANIPEGAILAVLRRVVALLTLGDWYTALQIEQLSTYMVIRLSMLGTGLFRFPTGVDINAMLKHATFLFAVREIPTEKGPLRYFRAGPRMWDCYDEHPSHKEELAEFVTSRFPESFALSDLAFNSQSQRDIESLISEGVLMMWMLGKDRKLRRIRGVLRGTHRGVPFSRTSALIAQGFCSQLLSCATEEYSPMLMEAELVSALDPIIKIKESADSEACEVCSGCGGEGMVPQFNQIGPVMISRSTHPCLQCKGAGKKVKRGKRGRKKRRRQCAPYDVLIAKV